MFSQNDKLQHIKGNVLLIRFAVCRTRMRLILSSSTSQVKHEKWKREKGKRAQMATVLHSSSNRRNGLWSTFQKKPVDFRKNNFNNITHTHTYIESASTQKRTKTSFVVTWSFSLICFPLSICTDMYRHLNEAEILQSHLTSFILKDGGTFWHAIMAHGALLLMRPGPGTSSGPVVWRVET